MKSFKEIIIESTKYSKSSAISSSKEISEEIYNLVQNSNKVSQELGRVSKNKMTKDMFTIEIYRGQTSEDYNAKPLVYKQHQKTRGKKAYKFHDYICIKYYDWFNGDTVRMNFKTPKAFNEFLNKLREMK